MLPESSTATGTSLTPFTVTTRLADDVSPVSPVRVMTDRETILDSPEHPYTWGLLQSIPRLDAPRERRLQPIAARADTLVVRIFDKAGEFVLDTLIFSSIIYILYEGGSLSPPVGTIDNR